MICIDARMISAGGIGTYIRNIIPLLPFPLLLIVHPDAATLYPWLSRHNLLLCTSPIYSAQEQIVLPRLIPRCALYWSPHFNIPLLPIRAKKRLTTIHDTYHLTHHTRLKTIEKWYAKLLYGAAVRLSEQIITVSEFSRMELEHHITACKNKISAIHHGVDPLRFPLTHEQREKYILFVGNVKPHKNIKRLIQAFKLLLQNGLAGYKLVIAGKIDGFFHGEELNKEPFVDILGQVSDNVLQQLYQKASVCVLPSLYEGFGLPAIEAMRAGCPLVVSNIPSLVEICGTCATYVDPHSIEDIARGIQAALIRPTEPGFERSRAFSWEKSAAAHTKIINQLIAS
jgi:glycosyltransferase involved in cell wall biosynthesis